MKLLIAIALIVLATAYPSSDVYDKFKNFHVSEVVNNKRLLHSYVHCLIGDGKCTPQGKDIKEIVPQVLQTNCSGCSPIQKYAIAQMMKAIIEHMPKEWQILLKQYDPENTKTEALNEFLAKYQ